MRSVLLFFILGLLISFAGAGMQICIDLSDPSAPDGLSVSGEVGAVVLVWGASVDEPDCSRIAEYVVSREGIEIGRVGGDVLDFVDNESLGEGEYVYTVYAIDMVGRNAGSAIMNIVEVEGNVVSYSGRGGSSGRICDVNWSCGEWSECLGGDMRRICVDLNRCGTLNLKPVEYMTCVVEEDLLQEGVSFGDFNEGEEEGFSSFLTSAVIGGGVGSWIAAALFVLIVLVSFLIVRSKRK